MREQNSGTVAFVGSIVSTLSVNGINSFLTDYRADGGRCLIRLLMRLVNMH